MHNDIIFGFSFNMNYSCSECNALCCKNEYKMPLFKFEKLLYIEEYPSVFPFIKTNKLNQEIELLRSNSCYFLTNNGNCRIHSNLGYDSKPFACQVYPLIFIKYTDFLFVYKYPCKGMKWHVDIDEIYEKEKIVTLSSKINNFYTKVFSDQIDGYNPFMYIDSERILTTRNEINNLKNLNWNFLKSIKKIDKNKTNYNLNVLFNFIVSKIEFKGKLSRFQNHLWLEYEKNLIIWLHYNPFFLALEINFASILIYLGITWARELLYAQINLISANELKNQDNLQIEYQFSGARENIVWNTIEIVTSNWWTNLIEHYIDKIFPDSWKSITNEIDNILKNRLLPFPEQ